MKAEIRSIGNSRGIILPKAILEQCGFDEQVEMAVENDALIIRPAFMRRRGWREAFGKVNKDNDGRMLRDWQNLSNQFDNEDWQW